MKETPKEDANCYEASECLCSRFHGIPLKKGQYDCPVVTNESGYKYDNSDLRSYAFGERLSSFFCHTI